MEYHFLFIHSAENQSFGQVLAHVLASYGPMEVIPWVDINKPIEGIFTLVFLDAGILADTPESENLARIVSDVCLKFSPAKVIIFTTSPTWRRARESLQAGATDYLRQTLDEEKLRAELMPLLQNKPHHRNNNEKNDE